VCRLAERTTSSRANGATDIPCRRARRVPVAAASSGHGRPTEVRIKQSNHLQCMKSCRSASRELLPTDQKVAGSSPAERTHQDRRESGPIVVSHPSHTDVVPPARVTDVATHVATRSGSSPAAVRVAGPGGGWRSAGTRVSGRARLAALAAVFGGSSTSLPERRPGRDQPVAGTSRRPPPPHAVSTARRHAVNLEEDREDHRRQRQGRGRQDHHRDTARGRAGPHRADRAHHADPKTSALRWSEQAGDLDFPVIAWPVRDLAPPRSRRLPATTSTWSSRASALDRHTVTAARDAQLLHY